MNETLHCLECGKILPLSERRFSLQYYGYPVCMQDQLNLVRSGATKYAIDLYFALKAKHIPVVLEYSDGYKRVDIALPGKLYIEVNGPYHRSSLQELTDLCRTSHSQKDRIPTIPVPNFLLDNHLSFGKTVKELTKACMTLI